ncbi:MAG TPA: arylamine N-acetyltransferase [Kineosporiaceae bacterium]
MEHPMNVRAYLDRIGIKDQPPPDAATLQRLTYSHVTTVPWENFSIYLDEPFDLSVEHLEKKIVGEKRGGTCWELTHLFGSLLTHLGYSVELYSGATWSHRESRFNPLHDHIVLSVTVPTDGSGPWLVDVGLGEGIRCPLVLADGMEAVDLGSTYRLVDDGDFMVVWKHDPEYGEPEPSYRFRPKPSIIEEFVGMYLYRSTSPRSYFVRHWICTLATDDGWIVLLDDRVSLPNQSAKRSMKDEGELRRTLRELFRLELPSGRRVRTPAALELSTPLGSSAVSEG